MKTPEIYKEVDTRELSLTDGDVLREHLLVLACPRRFPVRGALFVSAYQTGGQAGGSKAFLFTRQKECEDRSLLKEILHW